MPSTLITPNCDNVFGEDHRTLMELTVAKLLRKRRDGRLDLRDILSNVPDENDPSSMEWNYRDANRSYGKDILLREVRTKLELAYLPHSLRVTLNHYCSGASYYGLAILPAPAKTDQAQTEPAEQLVDELALLLDTPRALLHFGSNSASEAMTITHAMCSPVVKAIRLAKNPGRIRPDYQHQFTNPGFTQITAVSEIDTCKSKAYFGLIYPAYNMLYDQVTDFAQHGIRPSCWRGDLPFARCSDTSDIQRARFGYFSGQNGAALGPMSGATSRESNKSKSANVIDFIMFVPPLCSGFGQRLSSADKQTLDRWEDQAIQAIEENLGDAQNRIHAFILEPIQGPGGAWTFRPTFIRRLFVLLKFNGVYIILDEKCSGLRTGKGLAIQHVSTTSNMAIVIILF